MRWLMRLWFGIRPVVGQPPARRKGLTESGGPGDVTSVAVSWCGDRVCLFVADEHLHLSASQALWLSDKLHACAVKAAFAEAGLSLREPQDLIRGTSD